MIILSFINIKIIKSNFEIEKNTEQSNYTDFNEFMEREKIKKSTFFSEEEKKIFENSSNEYSDFDKKRKYSNMNAQRKLNLEKNFTSQRKNLSSNVKKELQYFKLDENFKLEDLRKKYLFLAKLYHPDSIKNDTFTSESFNELRHNYEKLKVYYEMREKLLEMEKNVEDDGTIITEKGTFEWPEEINQPGRQEIIKELSNKYIFNLNLNLYLFENFKYWKMNLET